MCCYFTLSFFDLTSFNELRLNFKNFKTIKENLTMLSSKFSQAKMNELRKFKWREFKNEELKRSFMRAITLLGDSGISDLDKLDKWKRTKTEMNRLFSTAKVRIDKQNLSLEPNITSLFTRSRDYNYLALIWALWRDASGKKFAHYYPDYVELSNEATKEYGFSDYGKN